MDVLKSNAEFQGDLRSHPVRTQRSARQARAAPPTSPTEFPANLRHYVSDDVKSTGAKACPGHAPGTRRSFRDGQVRNDLLEPWAAAATKKVAAEEMGVPVLDLNADSVAAVQKMGPVEANTLAMAPPPPDIVSRERGHRDFRPTRPRPP
jgi:hypothetical protein